MSHVTRKWLKEVKLGGRNNLDAYILATKGLEYYIEHRIHEMSTAELAFSPKHQNLVKEFHESRKFLNEIIGIDGGR